MDQVAHAKVRSWVVPPKLGEVRLDAFARRCLPHLSRRALRDAIAQKLFRVDGNTGSKGDRLRPGDRLSFEGPRQWLVASPPPDATLRVPIVYEDNWLMVLNKPAGMASHGFSGRDSATLANFLAAERPALLDAGKSRWEAGLLHRLDRETSGLVLAAKTPAAFARLRDQFRQRKVKKRYYALVWGSAPDKGVIEYPLAHDPRDRRRMRPLAEASAGTGKVRSWPALTRYRVRARARNLSLLEIDMETGVTHQIRVHLAAIGHPIVGDTLYGVGHGEALGLARHFLHAARLEFCHPGDGRKLVVRAGLPRELAQALKRLRLRR